MKKNLPHICFLGCGRMAMQHSKMLKKLFPAIKLSFASSDGEKAESFRKKFKGIEAFSSYDDAIGSDKIDIIFIVTPHAYHAELAIKAANNKKDIIIEKPVTRTMEELSWITKAVEKNNVRCTVAENYFYKPSIKVIREFIDKGYIGNLLMVELNKTGKNEVSGWRTDPDLMGGGALLEGGIHWVDALISLGGSDPLEVIALKPDVNYESNVPFEDTVMVNAMFENGVTGKLTHSWKITNRFGGMSFSKIYGTEGVITFESNGLYVSLYGKKKKKKFFSPTSFLGFKHMLKAFIMDYMNDKEWQPDLKRITTEMQFIHSAYKSLKSKKMETIK